MHFTQLSLRAPGIHALLNGEPWTAPRDRRPGQPAIQTLQLESIQTIIQSSVRDADLPPSPISTVGNVPLRRASTSSPGCLKIEDSEKPMGKPLREEQSVPLVIPEVAKISGGGCFDPDNWVFKIVWDHVQHMNVEELMISFFRREDRGEYGEHHTSTRGVPDYDYPVDNARLRGTSSENHRQQEQGRRVRHRYFQKEADVCTSDDSLDMAQKNLPKIKRIIQTMHQSSQAQEGGEATRTQRGRDASTTKAASRKLGKDDQLAAVLMSLYTAFILIFRLQESLSKAQDEIEVLGQSVSGLSVSLSNVKHQEGSQVRQHSDQTHMEATYWRQKCGMLEHDNRNLQVLVMALRKQVKHEATHQAPVTEHDRSLLPLPNPSASSGKRLIGQSEGYVLEPSSTQIQSAPNQAKRPCWTFERQSRLPPSPSPSWGESTSPSFSSNWEYAPREGR